MKNHRLFPLAVLASAVLAACGTVPTSDSALAQARAEYIDAQSKAAKAMVDVLDAAEKAGFTFGINPESRELLLKGWREELDTLQQGVPTPLPVAKDAKDPKDPKDVVKKPEEKKP